VVDNQIRRPSQTFNAINVYTDKLHMCVPGRPFQSILMCVSKAGVYLSSGVFWPYQQTLDQAKKVTEI
jgi:hypothetical protein